MRPDTVEARLEIEPRITGRFAWQDRTLTFTPDEPWPAGETVQVRLRAGATSQGFLVLPFQPDFKWAFNVRQPRLVFLFPADGLANLYLRDPQGQVNQALTTLPAGVQDFSIVPGSRSIVFSAHSAQGGSDLYWLDLSTAVGSPPGTPPAVAPPAATEASTVPLQPHRLLACSPGSCRLPVVSPDGATLAFERSQAPAPGQAARPQVWIAPLDHPQDAAPASDPARTAELPAWSPHGDLTYYDQQAQAFMVLQLDGEELARFPNETGQPGSWQPTGQGFVAPEIGFLDANVSGALQNLERLANSHLMLYPWPQAAAIDLSQEEGLEDTVPVFSPDGAQLVFARKYLEARRWWPGRQIWLMELATRQARALTEDPDYNHFDFAWSPDGRRIAYVRFNQSLLTEPPEVWIMDVQTGEQTQLIAGGYSPQWIP
jgi:Tol biopolymer transport system component